jgi:hypothetical protein
VKVAELTHRRGVVFGEDRHEVTVISAIDASGIVLDAFQRGLTPHPVLSPSDSLCFAPPPLVVLTENGILGRFYPCPYSPFKNLYAT